MRITKYVHSCLLVETEDKKILIDPGVYSTHEEGLSLDAIDRLDYVLITHEHPDHMDVGFIKSVFEKFPDIKILTNKSVSDMLAKEKIASVQSLPSFIQSEAVSHEKVFGVQVPENWLFRIDKLLTHPGDSLHFELKTPVLALPVQAPWCSLTEAVTVAERLKPKTILPIHDWHWNDSARDSFYERLAKYFDQRDIQFLQLKTGQAVEV